MFFSIGFSTNIEFHKVSTIFAHSLKKMLRDNVFGVNLLPNKVLIQIKTGKI